MTPLPLNLQASRLAAEGEAGRVVVGVGYRERERHRRSPRAVLIAWIHEHRRGVQHLLIEIRRGIPQEIDVGRTEVET